MPDPHPSDCADEAFAYLTTTGRRTGRPHTIEIWFAVDRDVVYLMAGGRDRADWVRNALVHEKVGLRIGPHEWEGRARIVEPGAEEDTRVRPLLRHKYADGEDDLVSWSRTALPVAIEGLHRRRAT